MPAAAVIRKVRALSGIIGFKGSAGWRGKPAVKRRGPTPALLQGLPALSPPGAPGIRGVAVKCLDVTKNAVRESGVPGVRLTLRLEGAGIEQD